MTAYVLSVNDLPTLSGVYLNGDTITLQDGSSWIFHQEQGFSLLGVSSVDTFLRGKLNPVTGGIGFNGVIVDMTTTPDDTNTAAYPVGTLFISPSV